MVGKKIRVKLDEILFLILCSMIVFSAIYTTAEKLHIKIAYVAFIASIPIILTRINLLISNKPIRTRVDWVWFITWLMIYIPATILAYKSNFVFLGLPIVNQTLFLITLGFILYTALYYRETGGIILDKLAKVLYFLLVIGLFLSIRALENDPYIIRSLANGRSGATMTWSTYGVLDYSMIYVLAIIFPIFISKHKITQKNKFLNIFVSILVIYVVYQSNLTTALFVLILGILLTLVFRANNALRFVLLIPIIFLTSLILNRNIIYQLLINLADYINNPRLSAKFVDMAISIMNDEAVGTVDARFERYTLSWESFMDSPFIGMAFITSKGTPIIGGHATGIDILGMVGLLGFIPFIAYIYFSYKIARKEWKNTPYYNAILICFINVILIIFSKKVLSSYAIFLAISLIIPVLPRFYNKKRYNN